VSVSHAVCVGFNILTTMLVSAFGWFGLSFFILCTYICGK